MPSKCSVPRTCEQCCKNFLAKPGEVAKGWARYCSKKCKFIAQIGSARGTLEERFWSMVDKSPGQGPKGECWIWTGALAGTVYGKMTVDHRSVSSHVIAYEIQNGPIPPGSHVLHRCDMPTCMRGSHLFLGKNIDNIIDSMTKGRRWRKLTPQQVTEIRDGSLAGVSQQAIADKYGVTQNLISKILLNQSRKLG